MGLTMYFKKNTLSIVILSILIPLYAEDDGTKTVNRHKITVLGTGYVGLVLGAGLADFGNTVTCADIDAEKIHILQNGGMPIYEPGLSEVIERTKRAGKLTFSHNIAEAIQSAEVVFIAVGTPTGEDGEADLSAVKAVAKTIGENLNGYKVICTKSTVPINTGTLVRKLIYDAAQGKHEFDIVSNPEFLREGHAVNDFFYPDRVVIGTNSARAATIMQEIYWPLLANNVPFVWSNVSTAEAIKYASNAFLAVKISFTNEIANLCDATGADIMGVTHGMGLDQRIGPRFLNPGPGFGGSCFPKDTKALLYTAGKVGIPLKIVQAALKANEHQKKVVVEKLHKLMHYSFVGKKIAVFGVAFKAHTDDIRCAPALTIIELLVQQGAQISVYDPVAMPNMQKHMPFLDYAHTVYDAAKNADAILILTEWPEFAELDFEKIRSLVKEPIIMDARNLLSIQKLHELGFTVDNIGRSCLIGT